MIQLQKGQEPEILSENKEAWTRVLLEHKREGKAIPTSLQNNYNQPGVKSKLREDSYGKCIYCESPIAHITYEHIEHIKPKAVDRYPELTFEWTNLGLACPKCNMTKGNFFDEKVPFVNPFIDDPDDFLIAIGHFVYHRAGSDRGEITEKGLKLNRPELIERRKERIDMIRNLADKYRTVNNGDLAQILREELLIEIEIDKPYSMCAKSIFSSLIGAD